MRYDLEMVADGVIDARNVEARITLPAAVALVAGSASEGLVVGDTDDELVWRGRIAAGGRATVSWAVSVPASVRPGARFVTLASVRAQGVEAVRLADAIRVAASDLTGTRKRADRTVAWPGDAVSFELRASNAGPTAVELELRDSLPAGLVYVPGSAWSASGPTPEWRADAHVLTWRAPVPAHGAVELGLTAVYRGPGRQTNLMVVSDGQGTNWSDWADVVAGRDRLYLPWTARSTSDVGQVRP